MSYFDWPITTPSPPKEEEKRKETHKFQENIFEQVMCYIYPRKSFTRIRTLSSSIFLEIFISPSNRLTKFTQKHIT
jgi:hypothetical protein